MLCAIETALDNAKLIYTVGSIRQGLMDLLIESSLAQRQTVEFDTFSTVTYVINKISVLIVTIYRKCLLLDISTFESQER